MNGNNTTTVPTKYTIKKQFQIYIFLSYFVGAYVFL